MHEIDPMNVFSALLEIGRSSHWELIRTVQGAGNSQAVISLSVHKERAVRFMAALVPPDQIAFTKAIAAYEDTIGGVGSPTLLHCLFCEIEDPERVALDWVLRNTCSYWYYSPAHIKSVQEYDDARRRSAAAAKHRS